jgi:hypothetical protein
MKVATEGTLWGSVLLHNLLCDSVVLSDDAGQSEVSTLASLARVSIRRLSHAPERVNDFETAGVEV